MTDQNTAVLVDNVFKSYGSTKVLDGISLEVFQGELIALLGPSGCGKTTLLRLVAGLAFPAAGGIYIMGKDVTNTPTNGRNTAMVFQNYALFPHMNVLENVTFGLHFRRKHSKEQMRSKAKDVLSMAGLTGLEQRKPAQLSGGEQQRVALARALILEPEVLLLDEPLSNLDYRLRMSMRLEIRRLQRQTGITTIFVTHDQGEALSMSQRVAVISNGKVEQIGAPLDIYERPGTPFVADGILLLTRDNETGIRRISIPKMRSTELRQSNFLFTLKNGFHLLPPLKSSTFLYEEQGLTDFKKQWKTIPDSKTHFSSGNRQLDEVLGGGFPRGGYVILEIERDVPVKAVRLLEYPLLWNFMSQGRGVVFLRNVRNSERLRATVSSCVSMKTFDRLAKVIENRRYGEDQTKPYTVVISGEEKNIDQDMKLFDRVTPRLMKKTGKNVLRLISFAVLENLYARNIEKLSREIGHAIAQNRTFGNLTIATARPGLNITPNALNLVDLHLRLIERDGAVLFHGIKPRIGLHAVDVDNTSEQMSMRLTPMV